MKRILAVLLLAAMTLSLGLTAGAVFTDESSITHWDAVEHCTEMGILDGFPDGSFRPRESLTRAQLCKMLALAMNDGREPARAAAKSNPSFTDIRGHWAEKYIEYCYDRGIVAGMGDGSFRPDGKVTGVQAAKMIMVALLEVPSYGYLGLNWSLNVNRDARNLGLYGELGDFYPSRTIDREDTTQMIWYCMQWQDWVWYHDTETESEKVTVEGRYYFDLFYYSPHPLGDMPWYDADRDAWYLNGELYFGGLYGQ